MIFKHLQKMYKEIVNVVMFAWKYFAKNIIIAAA